MKKKYERPEAGVTMFCPEDMITASGGGTNFMDALKDRGDITGYHSNVWTSDFQKWAEE